MIAVDGAGRELRERVGFKFGKVTVRHGLDMGLRRHPSEGGTGPYVWALLVHGEAYRMPAPIPGGVA